LERGAVPRDYPHGFRFQSRCSAVCVFCLLRAKRRGCLQKSALTPVIVRAIYARGMTTERACRSKQICSKPRPA
jgi:hypothetical protein